ncbi:hypothetical protein [Pseudomonas aeruginosa]|uniref:hypothetical protein n=1 Tax=Pseudomonas aeruginosa TaxID=287 RepID=UPI003CF8DE7C
MTTSTATLSKARKSFLLSLDDAQLSTELLLGVLAQALQTPELVVSYEANDPKSAIDNDPVSWNGAYYSRHKILAEHNFSRERLEHLIQVRDHFRKQGIKGFVPSSEQPRTEKPGTASMQYTPSANLKKFVDEGDLLTIRTALRMELNDNRLPSEELRAALAWAKTKVPGLCESYSEKAFARATNPNRNDWTSEYYDGQVVYLKSNFSEERYLHLIEVRGLLRERGAEGFAAKPKATSGQAESSTPSTQRQSSQSQRPNSTAFSPERNPVLKTALMIGGAIAAVVVFLVALVK